MTQEPFDWNTVARRIKAIRIEKGDSVRELAAKAGLDKNTILRVEGGDRIHFSSLSKICHTLSIDMEMLCGPTGDWEVPFRICRSQGEIWAPPREGLRSKELFDPHHYEDQSLRRKLGLAGTISYFDGYRGVLPNGQLMASSLELYSKTPLRSHKGEEWVYCLKGSVTITVGEFTMHLKAGESATFRSGLDHSYAPSESMTHEELPAILLSVHYVLPE